jgi:hypothetical protein
MMRIFKFVGLNILFCVLIVKCTNRPNSPDVKETAKNWPKDALSNQVLHSFGLPNSDKMGFDSNFLIFYCSRAYDTSTLIQINKRNGVIQCAYYQLLPEYHRFATDYADTAAKVIFLEGFTFVMDSSIWRIIREQANEVLGSKASVKPDLKYTDGANYALYFEGQSKYGNSNDDSLYVGFDRLLKNLFVAKYIQLRKPHFVKQK